MSKTSMPISQVSKQCQVSEKQIRQAISAGDLGLDGRGWVLCDKIDQWLEKMVVSPSSSTRQTGGMTTAVRLLNETFRNRQGDDFLEKPPAGVETIRFPLNAMVSVSEAMGILGVNRAQIAGWLKELPDLRERTDGEMRVPLLQLAEAYVSRCSRHPKTVGVSVDSDGLQFFTMSDVIRKSKDETVPTPKPQKVVDVNPTMKLSTLAKTLPPDSDPYSTVIAVTPEMAEEWLTYNFVYNRPLDDQTVLKYALAMEEDRWEVSPDCIAITTDMRLVGGQHRLTAVTLSGKTVKFSVMFNVTEEMLVNMDGHKPHTPSNKIHQILGPEAHATVLAPMIQLMMRYEVSITGKKTNSLIRLAGTKNVDRFVLTREIEAHPGVIESAAFLDRTEMRVGLRGIASITQAAMLHYYASKAGKQKMVEEFLGSLASGENLPSGSPILALRNKMISMKAQGVRSNEQARLNLLVRSWKSYERGEVVYKMYSGKSDHAFPII